MYRTATLISCTLLPLLFCKCVTTEEAAKKDPPITVQGTLFYPDNANQTYVIPAGAEIIGAGGRNCRFIVENGGRMTAHSGTNNTYEIRTGGSYKGFDHPALNCRVEYQNGARIEKVKEGERVSFTLTR
jgi:hypothetical protein